MSEPTNTPLDDEIQDWMNAPMGRPTDSAGEPICEKCIGFQTQLSAVREELHEAKCKIEMLEEPCICSEYDGEGYSTCGVICPEHYNVVIDKLQSKTSALVEAMEKLNKYSLGSSGDIFLNDIITKALQHFRGEVG